MRKIKNKDLKDKYIEKFNLKDVFSEDISQYVELLLFEKGEHICKEKEKLNYIFFLVEGKAKGYVSLSNGRVLLNCFYYPLNVIGEQELINEEDTSVNIQMIEDSYFIGVNLIKARKKLLEDAKFLRYICTILGSKLRVSLNNNSINLLYPLENRLASYILATKVENEGKDIFVENFTELAELLGTSYRHLLRTINILVNKRAIRKQKSFYEIIDKKILTELSADLYQ